jgi:hypothetical protein
MIVTHPLSHQADGTTTLGKLCRHPAHPAHLEDALTHFEYRDALALGLAEAPIQRTLQHLM